MVYDLILMIWFAAGPYVGEQASPGTCGYHLLFTITDVFPNCEIINEDRFLYLITGIFNISQFVN